jgi:hypothetical protein
MKWLLKRLSAGSRILLRIGRACDLSYFVFFREASHGIATFLFCLLLTDAGFVILIEVVLSSFQDESPERAKATGRASSLRFERWMRFRQVAEAVTPHLLSGKFF